MGFDSRQHTPVWRKSSYSGGGNDCVEVAFVAMHTAVVTRRIQPMALELSAQGWLGAGRRAGSAVTGVSLTIDPTRRAGARRGRVTCVAVASERATCVIVDCWPLIRSEVRGRSA